MKVAAIKCPQCGDTIYSRATHDMRGCTCGAVAIDGGFDYIKVSGHYTGLVHLEVKATKAQLYADWNFHKDKFGLVKGNGLTRAIDKTKKPK